MRSNRMGSVSDVAEVGLMIFVQRRGDADDNGVHGGDPRIIRRGLESVGLGRRDFFRRNTENIGAAAGQGIDLSLIDIKTGHREPLLAIEQRQRQSDIAESDDSDLGLTRLDAAFQIGKEGRSGGLSCHKGSNNSSIAGRDETANAAVIRSYANDFRAIFLRFSLRDCDLDYSSNRLSPCSGFPSNIRE